MKRRHTLPAEVYALVDATPGSVLLEGGVTETSKTSQTPEEPWTRLFTAPLHVHTAHRPAEVDALFDAVESALAAGLHAAGFFSYECGGCFEPRAAAHAAGSEPLAWFGIYDRCHPFDHSTGKFVHGEPPQLAAFRQPPDRIEPAPQLDAAFALTEDQYAQRIDQIHEWIRAGDIYQLNFTAPWNLRIHGGAAALYAQLRERQPAPYGAFLHWQNNRRILSFSPELFFRVDPAHNARRITTRPMKGTAPRGRTTVEDRAQAEWLRNDPKNRSENVMIVDLLRNDLGRVARFGSVRATELFAVERYPTLWQMTSTVTAELREDVGYQAIFRALFPCGSVTGAPKVRAMQLIDALEGYPRGIYTGAIGCFSPRQAVFNVAIRTLQLDGAHGTMCAGSGIVIDSNAADEYRECLLKARFLTDADHPPSSFSLIETLLWNGAFPLLDLHLDRLADSAGYFGFACDREQARGALVEYARAFAGSAAQRVRLLLHRDGSLAITAELLPAMAAGERTDMGRVRIATERTDSADPMLFHKTTHRPLYAAAFQQAVRDGFADTLFFNQRGELTEGAISNVFVEKDGRLFTPPIECGLLAGVYRSHLLATRSDCGERVLHADDLRGADAIYLANALRGLRRVRIEWNN
ncbi:MAG TPA: aminodeoxychorismate synthase component I [Terracidiphilus sp.]|jgi:para-aminobenzoate synthetase/4-amino-4-deoxychorismate lyase|nr:aminodeoxychorismate synthase component I [Terracidiphilus sp.]